MVRRITAALLALTVLAIVAGRSYADGDGYQQYFRLLNKYPDDDENGFSGEANGIAHDDAYWYLTTNDCEDVEALWKVPVGVALESIERRAGVSVVRTDEMVCPTEYEPRNLRDDLDYDHLGDLVAYEYESQYYLLVPIENGTLGPAIAVLRADDLQCLGLDALRIDPHDPQKLNDASAWCAVDSEGYVYTSPNYWFSFDDPSHVQKLLKYSLNWDEIAAAPPGLPKLTYLEDIPLLGEDGQPFETGGLYGYAQGGEFSCDGQLLYLSSGGGDPPGWASGYEGLHVFDRQTWRRVALSDEEGMFKYDMWEFGEEAEGLTAWDLDEGRASYQDGGRAPHVAGQLHVLLLNNDWPTRDNVYIYHYSNTIYVDRLYPGDPSPNGTIGRPYQTVGQALAFYNQHEYFNYGRWTGGRIKIHTGTYDEALYLSRRLQLAPWSGQATVGLQGQIGLTPGGAVNIETGGVVRVH